MSLPREEEITGGEGHWFDKQRQQQQLQLHCPVMHEYSLKR